MKVVKKYYSICNDFTPHIKERFYEGVTRGLFALGTLGMSEYLNFNEAKYKCLKCIKK